MPGPQNLPARYYDGRSAVAHAVTLKVAAYGIDIIDENGQLLARWPRRGLRLGSSFAESGGLAITLDRAPDARAVATTRETAQALIALLPDVTARRRQHSRGMVLRYGAVILAILAIGAFVVDRLPEMVAPFIPFETKHTVGIAVAEAIFPEARNCLAPHGLARLRALGEQLRTAARIEHELEIQVVDHPMVNAFAAPGGVVVLTRGLIERAEDPDQVAGVLAHEIGHVQHDHPTVSVLRGLGITAMLQLLTGGSAMETQANAGGLIALLSYSRAAEEEADAAGIAMLEESGVNADGLSRFFSILARMEATNGYVTSWLSTHPPTEARRVATERATAGSPALTRHGWREVRAICTVRK